MFVKFKRYKFLTIVLSLLLILIPSYFAYEQKTTGYLEVIGLRKNDYSFRLIYRIGEK